MTVRTQRILRFGMFVVTTVVCLVGLAAAVNASSASEPAATPMGITAAITAVSPSSGTPSGGTTVTITGTGFQAGATVKFGTNDGTSVNVISATSITAVSPAGTGTVHITVTNPSNPTSAQVTADQFTYRIGALPTVTLISPNGGPIAGGTTVDITGANLTAATSVFFGLQRAASFTQKSATWIQAVSPAGLGTVDITVVTGDGTSATNSGDRFTFASVPTITAVSPNTGPAAGGTSVTISGTALTGASAVKFGTANATNYTVVSATSIVATSPAGTGLVDVTVTTQGGTTAIGGNDVYTYAAAPTITAVSPSSGTAAGGTTVTITGTNLTGATAVRFGATSATSFTVTSPTSITAVAPVGSGTVDITATTTGGTSATSSADQFTYIAVPVGPTVTSISPSSGSPSGSTRVTITGSGFSTMTMLKFGAKEVGMLVLSDSEVRTVSPTGTGVVDVTVTSPSGTSAVTPASKFRYLPAPSVTGVSPSTGTVRSGSTVTVTGTDFVSGSTTVTARVVNAQLRAIGKSVSDGAATVTVSDVNVLSSTTLTCKVTLADAVSATSLHFTVTTPSGASPETSDDLFTFTPDPTVTAVSPATGPTSGGTSVTLTGTDFVGVTAVKFGATAATSFIVSSATRIVAVAPALSAGTVDITVTNVSGTSAVTAADRFTSTASVPTMGEWFLALLATALVGLGYVALRQRAHLERS